MIITSSMDFTRSMLLSSAKRVLILGRCATAGAELCYYIIRLRLEQQFELWYHCCLFVEISKFWMDSALGMTF